MTDTRTFTIAAITFNLHSSRTTKLWTLNFLIVKDMEHKISGSIKIGPESKLCKIIAVYDHHFCQTHINHSGGSRISRRGAASTHRHPTRALFGENVCENERIGPRKGRGRAPMDQVGCEFWSKTSIIIQ